MSPYVMSEGAVRNFVGSKFPTPRGLQRRLGEFLRMR